MAGLPNGNEELFKPLVDDSDYRFITLSNGLRCLLVSDPEADKAAASLDVSIHKRASSVRAEGEPKSRKVRTYNLWRSVAGYRLCSLPQSSNIVA